jgi:leader peptidase (prepilin peptidase) / N-methyltransferase
MAYLFVAVFGLAIGSFLNVCMVRLPRHESIVTPRSHCPQCGAAIRWYDNIPVASYLVLRGRCRRCRGRISAQYPLVEALAALILVAAFREYGASPLFLKVAVLDSLALIVTFTDLRHREVPHRVTLLGMGLGLAFSLVVPVDPRPWGWILYRLGVLPGATFLSVAGAVAGALAGGGLFYVVGEAFYVLGGRQKEFLGFGDVMMMLMVGTFLGPPLVLVTMLVGSLAGTLVALPLTLARPRFRNYPWPYATFLGAATIFSSLWGAALLEAYLRWAGVV